MTAHATRLITVEAIVICAYQAQRANAMTEASHNYGRGTPLLAAPIGGRLATLLGKAEGCSVAQSLALCRQLNLQRLSSRKATSGQTDGRRVFGLRTDMY